MPSYVWVNPNNPAQRYFTAIPNDPAAVALGYVQTSTSDGSAQIADGKTDQNVRSQYVGGLFSGGYPAYNGYTDGSASNGILGG